MGNNDNQDENKTAYKHDYLLFGTNLLPLCYVATILFKDKSTMQKYLGELCFLIHCPMHWSLVCLVYQK